MNPINQKRRTVLLTAVMLGILQGCGEKKMEQSVAPLEIDPRTTCDLDGMLLSDFPGPKAQVFYAGQNNPVFFCDTVELFHTLLAPEQVRKVQAVYVQDMGKADWEQPQGNWIDANAAYYVFGSRRRGSMGTTIASFSQESAAGQFATQWGGRLLRYADIRADMVDLSGGALHDSKM
ncbi:nitrous oxide reductase accessory protein NosL [Undibacterium oligocarboniphilum]|uniref:Nitrous oxide reductase accessory protein NosL n=1 Tax=Undibacterium oligocarboniphilum TaxID=666702 RepID=A0A850QD98_9BURK|nr:nitrous oxide reductase accessory protein NosL [Undibacterium oligocarboniphilum]MBC3869935.1 nitrous oxide reductase accessory protein NosL [Undibacterium oligocarboniphilum]NVO77551.1 nitrous oxide reductase accessory protein NosL [Undibacterium oligocarboniphilum]